MNFTIHISSQIGTDISSRTSAARLREEIVREVVNGVECVTLDFAGVRTVSESFADEFFAILASEFGDEWFRTHIRVVHLNPFHRKTILGAIAHRICAA